MGLVVLRVLVIFSERSEGRENVYVGLFLLIRSDDIMIML